MSGEDEKVSTYAEFRDNVLPRIAKQGYTAIQLMAIQVCQADEWQFTIIPTCYISICVVLFVDYKHCLLSTTSTAQTEGAGYFGVAHRIHRQYIALEDC